MYELPRYSMYTNFRNIHGGGVALYVSNDHDSSLQNQIIMSDSSIESISVQTTVVRRNYSFLCIYRYPGSNSNNFQQTINNTFSYVYNKNDESFHVFHVFGDFNLNLLKCNENNVSEFINLMHAVSLFH